VQQMIHVVRYLIAATFALVVCCLTGCIAKPTFDSGPVDADAPTAFTQTESGLKYRILRKSDGPKPTASNTVTVHYAGWLDDMTEFDSSYRRGGPATFALSGVVPGWTEGLQLVGKGGMIELEIPSFLGYGAQGAPGSIPPNATLHFKVELLDIQ
jgi:FKBP-type peptidyl-prolyl cis-trans isomerase FkpA